MVNQTYLRYMLFLPPSANVKSRSTPGSSALTRGVKIGWKNLPKAIKK
jgi:hypothetical protein